MKTIKGKVVSNKMQNTVVVEVVKFVAHPMYRKRIKRTKNYHADDRLGAKMGDFVQLEKTKPISKTKHWKVVKIGG